MLRVFSIPKHSAPAVLLLLFPVLLGAQTSNLGTPPVYHFPKSAYGAGTQSWDITQDDRGVVFLANNEGLLTFDGALWKLFPLPNQTCVRSLLVAPDGKVFVGGQGELGWFEPGPAGDLQYRSLLPLIDPADRNFTDVWDIVPFQGGYFFRTANRVFRYQEGKMAVLQAGNALEMLGTAHGALYLHDQSRGLCRYDGAQFVPLPGVRPPSIVTAVLPWRGDSVLFTTLKHGFFSLRGQTWAAWPTPADDFLRDKRIYTASVSARHQLVLGTTLGGLLVLDDARRPTLWLHKGNGIQNNTILSLLPDRSGNIWLGLDNGIDYVEANAPLYRILPDGDLEGPGYAARYFDGQLYLGTSNGLFHAPWMAYANPFRAQTFRPVAGTTGQVWGLDTLGKTLLLGHHEGAFQVSGDRARPLSGPTGAWRFTPLSGKRMIAGQYDGLLFFEQTGSGAWKPAGKLPGFSESARILVAEGDSVLWVSHPYRGVFRVRTRTGDVQRLGAAEGLPSDLQNYVFRIGGQAVVAAERGVFRYDGAGKRFAPLPEFNDFLPQGARTRHLCEDLSGNIWFVHGEEAGVLWIKDDGLGKSIQKQTFAQLNGQMLGGFEHIYPLDRYNLFFGTEKGFLHLDTRRLSMQDTLLQVLISRVSLPAADDSLLYNGFPGQTPPKIVLPYSLNSLHVVFGATSLGASRKIEYSSLLEGLDKNWSGWSAKTELDLSRLPPGQYSLLVRARDDQGRISAPVAFAWRVLPPWYATRWAYLFYMLLFAGVLFLIIRRQRKRFEQEKERMANEHRRKEAQQRERAEQSEQELVRVRNEKLEAEVQHKNQELALATMHLVQKGEMLTSIQEALERVLQSGNTPPELRAELRRVARMVQQDNQSDEDWEHFAVHFDQVYGDFLKRLRERSPKLSPNDYRLCAYLRMNLNTKEIAHLMNISVRGVEGSRYRLRQKLELKTEENLVDFLMGL